MFAAGFEFDFVLDRRGNAQRRRLERGAESITDLLVDACGERVVGLDGEFDVSDVAGEAGSGLASPDGGTVGDEQLGGGSDERDERRDDERVQRARAEAGGEPERERGERDERERTARRSHPTRTADSAARITSSPVCSVFATGRTRWASVTTASRWTSSGST